MRAIPGATSEDEFVACWAAGGEGGVLLLAGRRSQFRQLKIHEAQSEGWAFTRNLVFLVSAKHGISARKVRDVGEVLALLGSHTSTYFFTPLFVNWKTCDCVGTENTASRAGVNGTEVVQSGTNVPYSTDEN